jgi:anti-sigma factor RsiW
VSEMNCKELVETITAYLEETLPAADRQRFDEHLEQCDACTEYLSQMRRTIARLGTVDVMTLSPGAREQLVALFRSWRGQDAGVEK